MADNPNDIKLDRSGGTNLSEKRVLDDVEALSHAGAALEQLNKNETMNPDLRLKRMAEEVAKIEAIISRYESEENKAVLHQAIEKTGMDADAFQAALNKTVSIIEEKGQAEAKMPASEFEKKLDRLRPLYESTQNMKGLSDAQKIERYEKFLEAYIQEALPLAASDEGEWYLNQISNRLGIPPRAFADQGADYIALKAKELKALTDKADTYSMTDARDDLKQKGINNPSQQEIERHYVSEKKDLYQAAKDYHESADQKLFIEADDMQRLENQAKVSGEYLENQIETLELHEQELELRTEGSKRAATTPAPVPTPASAPTSTTQETLPISTAAWQDSAGRNTMNSMKV